MKICCGIDERAGKNESKRGREYVITTFPEFPSPKWWVVRFLEWRRT
jgi:hypothetical protein